MEIWLPAYLTPTFSFPSHHMNMLGHLFRIIFQYAAVDFQHDGGGKETKIIWSTSGAKWNGWWCNVTTNQPGGTMTGLCFHFPVCVHGYHIYASCSSDDTNRAPLPTESLCQTLRDSRWSLLDSPTYWKMLLYKYKVQPLREVRG